MLCNRKCNLEDYDHNKRFQANRNANPCPQEERDNRGLASLFEQRKGQRLDTGAAADGKAAVDSQ